MKFYYAPMSCAFATHVLLEDAGAQYSAVRIDLKKGDQNKPKFLKNVSVDHKITFMIWQNTR